MTESPRLTRRRLIVVGGGVAAAAYGGVQLAGRDERPRSAAPPVRSAPDGWPAQQHQWDEVLRTDASGNRLAPRHHHLIHLSLQGAPTVAAAAALEDGLRELEERHRRGPAGLLMAVGWSARWFTALGVPSPVPPPEPLAPDELPDLDSHVACIHLASDDQAALAVAGRSLRRAVRAPFGATDVRAGATGSGLARRQARGANGIPTGQPRRDSPLFMGFSSGRRKTQATEEHVTITEGPWAGGTTMHVSVLSLALATWFGSLDEDQRAARMFAPGFTARQARRPTADVSLPADLERTARRHGLVGHAQTAAEARVDGLPRIIRRDFNGRDGRQPLVHFVALQRSIDDFVVTRQAMNASRAVSADDRVGPHVNNGINEWITTRSRANYIVPVRGRRTCPGLAGWDA